VLVKGNNLHIREFVRVRIIGYQEYDLIGEVLES